MAAGIPGWGESHGPESQALHDRPVRRRRGEKSVRTLDMRGSALPEMRTWQRRQMAGACRSCSPGEIKKGSPEELPFFKGMSVSARADLVIVLIHSPEGLTCS